MFKKSCLLVLLVIGLGKLFSQTDSAITQGTIKIIKPDKKLYIKAIPDYKMYRKMTMIKGNNYGAFIQANSMVRSHSADQVIPPLPLIKGYEAPFDYTKYLNSFDVLKNIKGNKDKDTIKVVLYIQSDGQYVYEGSNQNNKEYETKILTAINDLKKWEPAYEFVPKYNTKKKKKTLKFDKNALNTEVHLYVLFSSVPF